ncbi:MULTISPECIES: hypothetical protein [Paenibacillus]|uniref:Uncharacterized protein n=1 Tax=Paenibacillus albilobatus TaxID=2716884 RepID=A0A919XJT9_9BACL|nr:MULTISPECIES: hypothetical protein [Paenibacillus]GIO31790.1 hypothetical protein J2TS6_29310 [Paenibacillus albilobatus]
MTDIEIIGDRQELFKRMKISELDFKDLCNSLDAWKMKSEDLFYCASVLELQLKNELKSISIDSKVTASIDRISSTYMLLIGYSFELLIKTIYVSRNLQPVFDHNLFLQINRLNIVISDAEKHLLGRLTDVIYWEGRYPTPKKIDYFKEKRNVIVLSHDLVIIHDLYERLRAQIL